METFRLPLGVLGTDFNYDMLSRLAFAYGCLLMKSQPETVAHCEKEQADIKIICTYYLDNHKRKQKSFYLVQWIE